MRAKMQRHLADLSVAIRIAATGGVILCCWCVLDFFIVCIFLFVLFAMCVFCLINLMSCPMRFTLWSYDLKIVVFTCFCTVSYEFTLCAYDFVWFLFDVFVSFVRDCMVYYGCMVVVVFVTMLRRLPLPLAHALDVYCVR